MAVYAEFVTTEGSFTVRLFDEETPNTVANFVGLAEGTKEWTDPRTRQKVTQPYYDGIVFHRVIEGFMAQTGCPHGTGTGGSKYPNLKQEFNREPHVRGTCSMARAQNPDSANSQFFICFGDASFLNNQYTVVGEVTSGMDVVDAAVAGEPAMVVNEEAMGGLADADVVKVGQVLLFAGELRENLGDGCGDLCRRRRAIEQFLGLGLDVALDLDMGAEFAADRVFEACGGFMGGGELHVAIDFEIETHRQLSIDLLDIEVVDSLAAARGNQHDLLEDGLGVERHRIGGHGDVGARKRLVEALDLLQAGHVGGRFLEPAQHGL